MAKITGIGGVFFMSRNKGAEEKDANTFSRSAAPGFTTTEKMPTNAFRAKGLSFYVNTEAY